MRFWKYFFITTILFSIYRCRPLQLVPPRLLIVDGQAREVITRGETWEIKDGYMEGHGWYNELYTDRAIQDEDFLLKASLSLARIDTSTALVYLFNNHFGFDSKGKTAEEKGRFFFYSPEKKVFRRFGKAADHITPGQPFLLEIERKGADIRLRIDGKEVASLPGSDLSRPLRGVIGFRPWDNRLRIYDLNIQGPTDALPELDYVFEKGEGGYVCIRIPSIIRVPSGDLLAFAEGRKDNCWTDAGDIDLIMKRSGDGGKSWGPLRVVWDDGPNTCAAHVPIWEGRTGRLLMLVSHSPGNNTYDQIISGKSSGGRRVYLLESWDEGRSWLPPQEITPSVKSGNMIWYGTGPGSGIQLTKGSWAGRLVAACHHQRATDKKFYAHSIYSDDSGATWQLGGIAPQAGGNECEVEELKDGSLLLNMRNYDRTFPCRQVMRSYDGGQSWTEQVFDTTLVEPICQASLVYLEPSGREQGMLLFSNPADTTERINLTLRYSPDGGYSWPGKRLIHAGPSAYSDLVDLGNGQIGVLYERGNIWPYQGISFQRIDLGSAFFYD